MALRFPNQIPESIDKGTWSQRLGHEIRMWMQAIEEGMAGLQGTPDTPSEVQAGVAADASDSQAAAPSNHVHSIETATPSVPVAFGGSPDEGSGTALMRADATLVLEAGTDDGDILVWDENDGTWLSTDAGSAIEAATETAIENSAATISEILIELKTITYLLKAGLNVPDDPDRVRRSYESESNSLIRELRTIAYYLYVGLNIREEPDHPRS